jgi:esterase/lipase superfamily enzyme
VFMGKIFFYLSLVAAGVSLMGCSPRGTLAVQPETSVPTREKTVLVATSRTLAPPPAFFGEDRSYATNFSKFRLSIPPERAVGEVDYPRKDQVDPKKQFLVSSVIRLENQAAFTGAINADLEQQPKGVTQGYVFVHGFNTNSAEGIIRATALAEDTGRQGVEVVYSWPSAGSVLKYLDDRESALFARDGLKETLGAMSQSQLSSYMVIAHSMGTFVTMDSLRELAQTGKTSTLQKIKAVVLISADLDIDVFRKQAPPVLASGIPIILLTTGDDLALSLSSKLRGQGDRVGDIKSISQLGNLDVTVFDLTSVKSGDPLKHFKIGASPEILAFLKSLNQSGQGVLNSGAGGRVIQIDAATLEAATGATLSQ